VEQPQRELLVVHVPAADASTDAALMAGLRRHGTVTGRLAPRLALIEPHSEQADSDEVGCALAAVPGVLGVFATAPPPAFYETLNDTERLFVDAWLARAHPAGAPEGDGLPWDADPNRLPPDLPSGPPLPPSGLPPAGLPPRS
jgi:hypothetical protein